MRLLWIIGPLFMTGCVQEHQEGKFHISIERGGKKNCNDLSRAEF